MSIATGQVPEHICLYPEPRELTIGQLTGTLASAQAIVRLRALPKAILSDRECGPATPSPINIIAGSVPDRSFRVSVPVSVPYSVLTAALQEQLANRPIGTGPDAILIRSVSVKEAGGKLIVSVETAGFVNGTVHFIGTPTLGADLTTVHVPDIDITQESREQLNGIVAGLGDLFSAYVQQALRQKSFSIAAQLERTRTALSRSHSIQGLTTTLSVNSFRPSGIWVLPERMVIAADAEGAATANVVFSF